MQLGGKGGQPGSGHSIHDFASRRRNSRSRIGDEISEGNFADLTILNLDQLSDEATYLDPHRYPKGVEYVLVNGIPGVEQGRPTGVEAGRPIRRD